MCGVRTPVARDTSRDASHQRIAPPRHTRNSTSDEIERHVCGRPAAPPTVALYLAATAKAHWGGSRNTIIQLGGRRRYILVDPDDSCGMYLLHKACELVNGRGTSGVSLLTTTCDCRDSRGTYLLHRADLAMAL